MGDFVGAYAHDTTIWNASDEGNKEYNDAVKIPEANSDLQSIRAGLQNALDAKLDKKTKCDDLFHLITCDFAGIRLVSPFEFTFKRGKWNPKNLKDSTDSDSPAGAAYLSVKYGKNWKKLKNWNNKKDLKTADDWKKNTQVMFEDGKGRDGKFSAF